MRKRLFAAFVCLCMMVSLLPTMVFAETGIQDSGTTIGTSGLCEYHTQHDDVCGYTEGTAEVPCSHEHTEDCYTLVTNCVHEHTAEGYSEERTEPICGHVCSEESGCITKELNCNHEHDGNCGYVLATEGTPCTYVCEICNAQDNGNPATPSDAQPEECTCETLCTEEEIDADCPVCSVEGAELDKVCVGVAPMLPVTALAADNDKPKELYVGNTKTTSDGYWTSSDGGTTWTQPETVPSDNYIYYDGDGTLTLHNVSFQGEYNEITSGHGTYATSSSGSVSLSIVLEEKNNVSGMYGIKVSSDRGNASLNISGSGSLIASSTAFNGIGIFVSAQTGDANLTIEGANVTASGDQLLGSGVQLTTSQTGSPNLTIAVKGGSLQASGERNGIIFFRI